MTVRFPAFAPDHPDAEILEAFEQVRSLKVHAYAQEDLNRGVWPEGEAERIDAQQQQAEAGVAQNFASSPAGVAARLCLLIPDISQDRWIDRGLMEQGILALYRARQRLPEHSTRQLIQAAYELLYIDWDNALSDYERRAEDLKMARTLYGAVEAAWFGRKPEDRPAVIETIYRMADDLVGRFSPDKPLEVLIRTLAPDHDAYQRKCKIIVDEEYDGEVTPWLARDTAFLLGSIPEQKQGAA